MELPDVLMSPANLSTFSSCVDLDHIELNPALQHEIFPIVTPLLWEKWQDALTVAGVLDDFKDIPYGLCFSFHISICDALLATFTPPNHPSSVEHSSIILVMRSLLGVFLLATLRLC
jgi:hypothetical protein